MPIQDPETRITGGQHVVSIKKNRPPITVAWLAKSSGEEGKIVSAARLAGPKTRSATDRSLGPGLQPCWSSGGRLRGGSSRGLRTSCYRLPACPYRGQSGRSCE